MREPKKLLVTISPEGEVVVIPQGTKGPGCLALTKELENALGVVQERKHTQEYHQHGTIQDHQTVRGSE